MDKNDFFSEVVFYGDGFHLRLTLIISYDPLQSQLIPQKRTSIRGAKVPQRAICCFNFHTEVEQI